MKVKKEKVKRVLAVQQVSLPSERTSPLQPQPTTRSNGIFTSPKPPPEGAPECSAADDGSQIDLNREGMRDF